MEAVAKAIGEAGQRWWANVLSCAAGDEECWAKCRVSGRRGELQGPWVEAGRNFFSRLVPHEDEHRRRALGFAQISQSSRQVIASGDPKLEHHQLADSIEVGRLISDEEVAEPRVAASPVTREDLGRASWTFLHTLAAHYPDKPSRQQQKDVRELMAIISRMYPCKECADHFKLVLKGNPVQASSGVELSQWMCRVHNIVNRSLGKPQFQCQRVDARWGALHCDEGCDVQGRTYRLS